MSEDGPPDYTTDDKKRCRSHLHSYRCSLEDNHFGYMHDHDLGNDARVTWPHGHPDEWLTMITADVIQFGDRASKVDEVV
jgi:hypothetical protein